MRDNPALIIGLNEESSRIFRGAIERVNPLLPVRTLLIAEGVEKLETFAVREHPRMVFLCTDDMEKAMPILLFLRSIERSALLVAFSSRVENDDLLLLMRSGAREWLQAPVDDTQLAQCLERLKEELEHLPEPAQNLGDLVSFFPAKPGSGASSLLMHTVLSMKAAANLNIALLDLDLNCGVQSFLWKADDGASVQDAVQNAERLDDPLWERLIVRRGNVHILGSGRLNPGTRIDTPQLHRLLGFIEGRYRLAFLDHSGNWERYSVDVMQRSSAIFQVCTTDFASLHHARRNLETFQEMGLGDRVHTVLNRASYHSGLDHRAVVSILGAEPIAMIPNAFHLLQSAIKDVEPPKLESPFGLSMLNLSKAIQEAVSLDLSIPGPANASRSRSWRLNLWRSMVKGLRAPEPVSTVEEA